MRHLTDLTSHSTLMEAIMIVGMEIAYLGATKAMSMTAWQPVKEAVNSWYFVTLLGLQQFCNFSG